jgi:hypothetical protein
MWNCLIWYRTGNSEAVVVTVLKLGEAEREGIIKYSQGLLSSKELWAARTYIYIYT